MKLSEAPFMNGFSVEPPEEEDDFNGWLPVGDDDIKDEDTGRVSLEEITALRKFILEVLSEPQDECDADNDDEVVGLSTGTHGSGRHGGGRVKMGGPSNTGTQY